MGSSKNSAKFQLVNSQGIGSTSTSGTIGVQWSDNVGIFVKWTAAALTSGTFSINASNDGTAYQALSLSGTPTVAGSADTAIISINQCPYSFLTITYTSGTTGTGSWNAWITTKELG